MATVADYINQLVVTVKKLPHEKVASVLDYARFLEWQERWQAMQEEAQLRVPPWWREEPRLAVRERLAEWDRANEEAGIRSEDDLTLDDEIREEVLIELYGEVAEDLLRRERPV
ncbi:MAG TPA: hypothetical protein EYP55_11645 [Anaerolineae bacterium]|nr:hypothetical protein [Anaerolineae bacterium]